MCCGGEKWDDVAVISQRSLRYKNPDKRTEFAIEAKPQKRVSEQGWGKKGTTNCFGQGKSLWSQRDLKPKNPFRKKERGQGTDLLPLGGEKN